jgi:calreticulin
LRIMRFASLAAFGLLATAVTAKTYLKETFDGDWEERWVSSDWKKADGQQGKWELDAGEWYGDEEADKGLKTSQDARFYAVSTKFDESFSNEGKDFVVQFSVKHAQKLDCGGGYVKIFPSSLDQAKMEGDSQYNIMFGPDICGTGTKKVHVIFNYKGENHLISKDIRAETDQLTHVYTLIVKPDQTYEVRIDGESKDTGNLLEDWDFLPAKMIKDPALSKPEDWVDDAMIDDPEDEKPAGWDDIAEEIVDPDAEKPDDWDDDDDGEWEAPTIDNPEYKGEWKAKRISNPDYKGVWEHPEIDNPDYEADDTIYSFEHGVLGFDLWQVKAGSIFDNIIVTDDVAEAEKFLEETWGANHEAEKEMFDEIEKEKREEEDRKRKEEEERRKAEEEEDDEDDDEDDDDDDDEDEDDIDDIDDKIKRAKDEL